MNHSDLPSCDRREFLRKATGLGVVAAPSSVPVIGQAAKAKKIASPTSETLVATLYKSLSDKQKEQICFDFDHELRSKVDNNWHIVKPRVSSMNKDQQAMVREIFMGLHSEEYADAVMGQVVHDSGKAGFESGSVAIFGEPGSGKFEFVYTGRHCTRRCDGDSLEGAAFGGPIFYGHAADSFNEGPDHKGNAYWFQAKTANAVYEALDGKQRDKALCGFPPRERGNKTVDLAPTDDGIEGIRVGDLSADQKAHVMASLGDMLAPFRQKDREESMKLVEAAGVDNLHMAFYKEHDIGDDKYWDSWQIKGPKMIWLFRGKPHVHTWVNIIA